MKSILVLLMTAGFYANAEEACSQAVLDSYDDAKVHLASTTGSDSATAESCKSLSSAKAENCKDKSGKTLQVKDLVEKCKNFARKSKSKEI